MRRRTAAAPTAVAAVLLVLLMGSTAAAAETLQDDAAPGAPVSRAHAQWLEDVELLITEAERQAFLALAKDYQRDAFVRRFWEVRDPYPRTARNEFQERWEERLASARQQFSAGDDRLTLYLYNGAPESTVEVRCADLLRPLVIWHYSGTERIRTPFSVVFVSPGGGARGPYRLWYPSQGFTPLLLHSTSLFTAGDPLAAQAIPDLVAEDCPRGEEIATGLLGAIDWGRVEQAVDVVPQPNDEWLATFAAYSTDLPADAATFASQLELAYPARHQSRIVVQGVVSVPLDELPPPDAGVGDGDGATAATPEEPAPASAGAAGETATEARGFVLDGEVLRQGELFEHFRYRFVLRPGDAVDGRLPLIFERYLRPGDYSLLLKLEDVAGGAFSRHEVALAVPSAPTSERAVSAAATPAPAAAPPASEPARRLAEANATLAHGEVSIELLPPPPHLLVGKARFDAFTTGAVERVRFELDNRPVLAKTRPPFSVELDLGQTPRVHTVRAVALGAGDELLASDEVLVNAGPHRFAVRLLEPQPGGRYLESLRANAAVEVPEGELLDRLELYLDETLVATLYQPPFAQPILLPDTGATHYVRAVAYLADGNSTEDAVIVNAPGMTASERISVRSVELYTTVVDRRGRPVEGLTVDDFTVLEEGEEQQITRFELVRDQPIYAAVMLDTSTSMAEELDDAVDAALSFFDSVLTPRDRAAVITFTEDPTLAVRFTNDRQLLAGGLTGLTAAGETSLYDSLVYGLWYFSGIKRKRALVLLSDGADVASEYSYEDVIDYARRTGVSIYTIGLALGTRQADIRLKLHRLATETGGTAFFIDDTGGLAKVYRTIEAELRSQYLLVYQASSEEGDDAFRQVDVKVDRPGLEAKTMLGYLP